MVVDTSVTEIRAIRAPVNPTRRTGRSGLLLEPAVALALCGEYDSSNAAALWFEVDLIISAVRADLVLDMRQVTFLDASTLSVFARAKSKLERDGRSFWLRALSPSVARIIDVCQLRCLVEPDGVANRTP